MKKKIGTQNLKMFREQLFPIFFLVTVRVISIILFFNRSFKINTEN
jgi:hypothetical protein